MPATLSKDELAAYFALRRASDRLAQAATSHLHRFGLTETQFRILAELGQTEDGLPMSRLARAITGSKSGLTYQVAKLQERGLLARTYDAYDRRSTRVALTAEGARLLETAMPEHIALVRDLFLDRLDRIDVATLRRTLEAIAS